MNNETKQAWTINALLAAIVILLAGVYFRSGTQNAYAAGGGWETDGVMAISTEADNERVVIIDTVKKNIMIYKQQGNRFRLVGARSYKYDVEIVDSANIKLIEGGNGASFLDVWREWNSTK